MRPDDDSGEGLWGGGGEWVVQEEVSGALKMERNAGVGGGGEKRPTRGCCRQPKRNCYITLYSARLG